MTTSPIACVRCLKGRPTVLEVALDAQFTEGESGGILVETSPSIEEIKSHGTYEFSFLFTSVTKRD